VTLICSSRWIGCSVACLVTLSPSAVMVGFPRVRGCADQASGAGLLSTGSRIGGGDGAPGAFSGSAKG
jgi:hypothetical protein